MSVGSRSVAPLAAALALAVGAHAAQGADQYLVDSRASSLSVHTGKAGLFGGHEHDITVGQVEGEVVADPVHLAGSSLNITISVASMKVADTDLSESDVAKVQRTMLSDRVLSADVFPSIVFRSRAVEGEPGGQATWQVRIAGTLDLHGQSRDLTVPATVTIAGDRLTATGTARLRQKDFGITPISMALGTVRVRNEVKITFSITAHRARSDHDRTLGR